MSAIETATPPETAASAPVDAQLKSDDEIVCPCTDLTRAGLRRMAAEGLTSFDDLLNTTAANGVVIGGRCTACRLDLEYLFTEYAQGPRLKSGVAREAVNRHDVLAFRQQIWRMIDRLSPMVPAKIRESVPVIAGADVHEHVIIANDSMMFEGEVVAPPMTVDIAVRDGEGAMRHRSSRVLAEAEALRLNVSQYLDTPPDGSLAVGSVEIVRRARRVGKRGTTRPQIVIDAPAGSCAVHTQDSVGPVKQWFAYYHRPKDERFFVSLVNTTRRPMDFMLSYPLDPVAAPDVEPLDRCVTVPPHGARLHEIVLPEATAAKLGNRLIRLRCKSAGPGGRKMNFICASPNLDRFSIDHPGR